MRGMMRLAIMGVPGAQGGAASILPLDIDFSTLEDGALPAPLTGATWAVSGGVARNNPDDDGELLSNPGFEGTYIDGIAPTYRKEGTCTPSEETENVHGGASAQRVSIAQNQGYAGVRAYPGVGAGVIGRIARASAWYYIEQGGIDFSRATNALELRRFTATSPIAEWVRLHGTLYCEGTASLAMLLQGTYNAANDFVVDDESLSLLDSSTLFALADAGSAAHTAKVCFALSGYEFVGAAVRMDSADKPQSGVIAYHNGTHIEVAKLENGLLTRVGTRVASTPVAGAALRLDAEGDTYATYYNGALTRTDTITGFSGTVAGAVSTDPENAITYLEINRAGVEKQNALYVATTGNDTTGDGSEGTPYATIAKANAVAAADGKWTHIIIRAGTYTETINPPRGGLMYLASGAVVIDGEGTRKGITPSSVRGITTQGLGYAGCTYAMETFAALNMTVRGTTLNNALSGTGLQFLTNSHDGVVDSCVCHAVSAGASFFSSNRGVVTDSEFYGISGRGVYFNNAPDSKAEHCHNHDPAGEDAYGYEAEADSDDVLFDDCWALGAFLNGLISKTSLRTTFQGCVVSGSANAGIYFKGGRDGLVNHCVAYDCRVGVRLYDNAGVAPASTGNTIQNTVFLDCDTAIEVQPGSEVDFASDYNCFYGCSHIGVLDGVTYDTLAEWQAATGQDLHSVEIDPAYEDLTYGGFLLPAGSPLLAAGSDGGPIGREG